MDRIQVAIPEEIVRLPMSGYDWLALEFDPELRNGVG